MLLSRVVLAVSVAGLACACGGAGGGGASDTGTGDAGSPDTFWTVDGGGDGAAPGDGAVEVGRGDGPEADGVDPGVWDRSFRIAFTNRGRSGLETDGLSDLLIWSAAGLGQPWSMGGGIEVDSGEAALDCNNGCILSDTLQWLAVADGLPSATDGTRVFRLGQVDQQLIARIGKGGAIPGVVDLHFGGSYLYYTTIERCEPLWCTYAFWRLDLNNTTRREQFMLFPTEQHLPPGGNQTPIFAGHFRVSSDGSTLALLLPTIRSQTLFVWRDGNLQDVDYICNQMQGGECIGAGSEYADLDPLAMTADGRKIALFSIAERELRVRLYEPDGGSAPLTSVLGDVDSGSYLARVCEAGQLEAWQPATVRGEPRFSADGRWLYFLGVTDCGTRKIRTDVRRLLVERIGQGTPLTAADVENLTVNPNTDDATNVVISAFDLSPAEDALTFAGTPMYTTDGEVIASTSSRQLNDTELWVQGVDGTGKRQLTNDLSWLVQTPKAFAPAP